MLKTSWFISQKFTKIGNNERLYTWMYMISILTISLSLVTLISVTTITKSIHNIISLKMSNKYPLVEVHEFTDKSGLKDSKGSNIALTNFSVLTKKGEDEVIRILGVKVKKDKGNISIVNKYASKLNGDMIVISKNIKEKMNLKLGDKVLLSSSSIYDMNNMKQYLFTIVGFMNNNYQYQAIIPIERVTDLDKENWKQLSVFEPLDILNLNGIIKEIEQKKVNRNKVVVWYDKIPSLYDAMKLERVAIYTIFFILLLISSFTIFATVASLGIKRKRDVAILRMLGCRRKQVFLIFILQGVKIFLITSILGLILSYLIILNIEYIFGFVGDLINLNIKNLLHLNSDESISLNVEINTYFVLKILLSNFIISILASLIPSYIIAKMETGDVVKYG